MKNFLVIRAYVKPVKGGGKSGPASLRKEEETMFWEKRTFT